MPLLKIISNANIPEGQMGQFLKSCSEHTARLLGKPEDYVMVSYQHNPDMLFAGTDQPLAYVELKSIGLAQDQTSELSAQLCELIQQQLAVPPERIYIEFADAKRHMFGWNSKTFAG